MRLFLIALAAFMLHLAPLHAQQPKVEMSAGFEEPETGWNKVMQLKNGNTFFFHFTRKNGIEVTVYDKSRKIISNKIITSELWDAKKMGSSSVEGLYEIGGQPVIFLQQVIDRTASLFRVKLDANTGEVAGDKLISTMPRFKSGSIWAVAYGGVEVPDFFVEKDPHSDCYSVVNFNSLAHENNERIEVIHYSGAEGKHKILGKAFYESPEGQFKYLRFVAMSVTEKETFLCVYGYNGKWSATDAKIIVSKLTDGGKDFTHKQLDFSEDFRDTKAVMQYNAGTNMLQMMSLTVTNTKGRFFSNTSTTYYLPLMTYIDPQSLNIISTKLLRADKVSEDIHRQVEKIDGYNGVPQNMYINQDNTTTVVMEEMLKQTTVDSRTGQVISATTTLGSIGISELDSRGDEQDGHVIIKAQISRGLFDPMYVAAKSKGIWSYRRGYDFNNNAFLSFDYVNTDNGKYILFNDYPENFEKEEGKRKRRPVVTVSSTNTVCYKMRNGKLDKFYLFGTPANDDQTKFCYVESSSYQPETKTYATLLMEKNGRDKQAHIAWVTFD